MKCVCVRAFLHLPTHIPRQYLQLLGVAVAMAWSALWTWLILLVLRRTVGIRIGEEVRCYRVCVVCVCV